MTLRLNRIGYVTAFLVLAFALASVDCAHANTTYNYEGAALSDNAHAPFSTTDSVTGTITFASPLAGNLNLQTVNVVSFSFTAGVETMTSDIYNPSFSRFRFSTDAAGNITAWDILVAAGGLGQISLENFTSVVGPNIGDQATVGALNFPPGTAFALNHAAGEFAAATPVPGPTVGAGASSFALVALLLGWLVRRRRGYHFA